MKEPLPFNQVEGQKWEKALMAVNLGSSFANYALFKGVWYSVNTNGNTIQDIRWVASVKERDQIVAILHSRLSRG